MKSIWIRGGHVVPLGTSRCGRFSDLWPGLDHAEAVLVPTPGSWNRVWVWQESVMSVPSSSLRSIWFLLLLRLGFGDEASLDVLVVSRPKRRNKSNCVKVENRTDGEPQTDGDSAGSLSSETSGFSRETKAQCEEEAGSSHLQLVSFLMSAWRWDSSAFRWAAAGRHGSVLFPERFQLIRTWRLLSAAFSTFSSP